MNRLSSVKVSDINEKTTVEGRVNDSFLGKMKRK